MNNILLAMIISHCIASIHAVQGHHCIEKIRCISVGQLCPEDTPHCCGAGENRHCCSTVILALYWILGVVIAIMTVTFMVVSCSFCFKKKSRPMDNEQIVNSIRSPT